MTESFLSCPDDDSLSAWLKGALNPEATDQIAKHLESCTPCQQRVERLDDAELLEEAGATVQPGTVPFVDESQCYRLVDGLAKASTRGPDSLVTKQDSPPRQLGDYIVLSPLGEGGMGSVYRARHRTTGTEAAIKILRSHRQLDRSTVERFEREMVALGRLDHPHIVRALDAGVDDGQHYLAMEYLAGIDLANALHKFGPMPIAEASEAVCQAALGLAYIHKNGRVHRDIKPSNLMLGYDGTVKLLDLGLARVDEYPIDEPQGTSDDILGGGKPELTRTHQVMGTLDYMAPEQATDIRSVDPRTDIYALGCTLYKLLTGHPPCKSSESISALSELLAHVQKPTTPITEYRDDVPASLGELIDRMLAKQPEDRPQTASEVAEALQPFATGADLQRLASAITAPHESTGASVSNPRHRPDKRSTHRDTLKPASEQPSLSRPLAGLAVMLLVALLCGGVAVWPLLKPILYPVPKGTVMVTIDSPEVAAEIATMGVRLDRADGQVSLKVGEGRMTAPAGQYYITVPDDSRLRFSQYEFEIRPDEQLILSVSLSPEVKIDPELAGRETEEAISPSALKTVSLIPLIDPDRDIRQDGWKLVDGALISRDDQPSMLMIAYRPPDHYRVEFTATRINTRESLNIGLSLGDSPMILAIDSYPAKGSLSGPYRINGVDLFARTQHVHHGLVLPIGKPISVSATVHRNGSRSEVELLADGKRITSWRGGSRSVSDTGSFGPTEYGVLFLANWTASFRIEDLRVTPLEGEGEIVAFADRTSDPVRAAMQLAAWKGGIVTVDVAGTQRNVQRVAGVNQLPADANVVAIDMQESRWFSNKDLRWLRELPDLRTLDLASTAISGDALEQINSLPKLSSLSLEKTGVTTIPESLWGKLPSLQYFNLQQTPVRHFSVPPPSQSSSLQSLNLSATPIAESDLTVLSALTSLRRLNLSQTRVTTEAIDSLRTLDSLEKLNLAGTRVKDLAPITAQRFPKLKWLNVLGTPVSEASVLDTKKRLQDAQPEVANGSKLTTAVSGGSLETVDVLSQIDLQRDDAGWETTWSRGDDGSWLTHPKSRTVLPIELPTEFDLEMTAVALSPINSTIFGLRLPDGTRFSFGFDHTTEKGKQAILHWLDGKYQEQSEFRVPIETFAVGVPTTIRLSVRDLGPQVAIRVMKDDNVVLEWSGDRSRFEVTNPWWLGPNSNHPWISQFDGTLDIRRLSVTPVSGRVTILDQGHSAVEIISGHEPVDLIALYDAQRDSIAKQWPEHTGVLQVPSHSRISLPIHLPPEFEVEVHLRKISSDPNVGNGPLFELPLPDGTRVMAGLDHWPGEGGYTIIHGIDGMMNRESPAIYKGRFLQVLPAEPVRFKIRVDGTGSQIRVATFADDEPVVAWEGDRSRLSPQFFGPRTDPLQPQIALYGGQVEIEKLTLLPLSGKIEFASQGASYADVDREVGQWALRHGGAFNVELVEGQRRSLAKYGAGDELPLRPFRIIEITDLENMQLTPDWLGLVGQLKSLTVLRLVGATFDNADLEPLAECASLKLFAAWGSMLDDRGLAFVARAPKLNYLIIGGTDVTEEGLKVLRNHPSLAGLIANDLPVDDRICTVAATIPNLQTLNLGKTRMTASGLEALKANSKLQNLDVSACSNLSPEGFIHLPALSGLKELTAAGNDLGYTAMEPIGQLFGLEKLILSKNPIGDKGVDQLTRLRSLNELHLDETSITNRAIDSLRQFPRLHMLSLARNQGIDDQCVDHLISMRRLQQLDISETRISKPAIERLRAALPNCNVLDAAQPNGGALDLRGKNVDDRQLPGVLDAVYPSQLILEGPGVTDKSIPTILSRPGLKALALYNTQISEVGVRQLSEMMELRSIEFWNMPHITGEVTKALSEMVNLKRVLFKETAVFGPGLERLHGNVNAVLIGNRKLDGDIVERYIRPFETLHELDLAGTGINDDDVALLNEMIITGTLHLGYNPTITGPCLRHVREMRQLKVLSLDRSPIGSAALEYLEGMTSLQTLNLRSTPIDDRAVEALKTLTGLRMLRLSGTQITPDGVAELKAALPECKIESDHE